MSTTEKPSGDWALIYTGAPAERDGESDSISHQLSYSNTYSGTFGGNIKNLIEADFNLSFSRSVSFSITKNSASLKKGKYVKAYYQKNFKVMKIKQTDLKRTTGYELAGGQYRPVDRTETETSYVTVNKALQPKLKLEYWKGGKKIKSVHPITQPEYTEYYKYINGGYQLTGEN